MFTYFWCVLELFIGKFIPNINNEHAQDCSCPGATFTFCSHEEKLPRQGGLPGVVQRVTRLSKLPRGNEKLMWTVTGVRPCTEAKFTPGLVSCPRAMSCPGIMWTGPYSLFTSISVPSLAPCLGSVLNNSRVDKLHGDTCTHVLMFVPKRGLARTNICLSSPMGFFHIKILLLAYFVFLGNRSSALSLSVGFFS